MKIQDGRKKKLNTNFISFGGGGGGGGANQLENDKNLY